MIARGAALVDATGALLAADAGFFCALGLPAQEGGPALQARAAAEPGLAALLRGEGPDAVALAGPDGEPLRLERHRAAPGLLLVLRSERDPERLEHAARSQGLGLLTGGLSHDVNGPLHAMNLQLALLEEKLGEGQEGRRVAAHLVVLREQVVRVARMIRRFRELAEPADRLGGLDVGALAAEALALLGHDLHRRDVQLALEAPAGVAHTDAPAERTVLLVLGVLMQAAATTPERGALTVSVHGRAGGATLAVSHTTGATPPDRCYYSEVAAGAAAALGGRLARSREEGLERVMLELPRVHQG